MSMLTRGRFLHRLTAILAILVWSMLLVHLGVHHHDDSDHCLLCSSAQSFTASVAPLVSAAFVLVGFIFKNKRTALVAKIATPSIPRSPPSMFSI